MCVKKNVVIDIRSCVKIANTTKVLKKEKVIINQLNDNFKENFKMSNKKPTDNEIKKALKQKIEYCREFDENNEAIVKVSLLENALNLINRQEKKMTELQELIDEMSDFFPACIDCEGKTKEGVRTDKCVYMIDNTNYCTKRGIKNISAIKNENRELKAEIEQLTKDKENLAYSLGNAVGQKMTAKAEAYKECIERVKENSNKMELVCSGALVRTDYTITKETLDNLLNEFERKENITYDD